MAEFVEAVLAQIAGNISTALILMLFYFNFLLFENYLRLIIWAILFSQALRQAKNSVVEVLKYLSDDPDVDKHGFFTAVFSRSFKIFRFHPNGTHRSLKEFILNYGVFLFSLIGAVSMWLRVSSWGTILSYCILSWLVTLSTIRILGRRLFFYRYFISDEVLVSVLLILGFFITATFVIVYLGTESYFEGTRAAAAISQWTQTNFLNDEHARQIWSEQWENSKSMIHSAVTSFENSYNETMWWPPLKSIIRTYSKSGYRGAELKLTRASFYSKLLFPHNRTIVQAISDAYQKVESVNLTSVQLSDWTTKGFELSSIAIGSLGKIFFLLCTVFIAFVGLGVRAFFFLSSLFYLLCTKWDPIERFVEDLLPIQPEKRHQVVHSLRKVIEGVFFVPLKLASLHAIVTLTSFSLLRADFVYLATTLTFFISIAPIIPPYLVCVPWIVAIGVTSSVIKASLLFIIQYTAFTILDDMLYEKSIVALHSSISALSVVFGVYVFGIEGVIFGPLSVCGVYFAYEVSNQGIQAAQDEGAKTSDGNMKGETNIENDVTSAISKVMSKERYFGIQPLADRVWKRFNVDTQEKGILVTIKVEGMEDGGYRFRMYRKWTMKRFCENLANLLSIHRVHGIYTANGVRVLSPQHVLPNEVLYAKLAPPKRESNRQVKGSNENWISISVSSQRKGRKLHYLRAEKAKKCVKKNPRNKDLDTMIGITEPLELHPADSL